MQPIKTIAGHVKLPGSKSLSNRILLLAALAEGTTTVLNLLVSFLGLPHMMFHLEPEPGGAALDLETSCCCPVWLTLQTNKPIRTVLNALPCVQQGVWVACPGQCTACSNPCLRSA